MQSGRTKYAVLLQSDAVNLVCITYDSYTHRGDIKMKQMCYPEVHLLFRVYF